MRRRIKGALDVQGPPDAPLRIVLVARREAAAQSYEQIAADVGRIVGSLPAQGSV